MYCELIVRRLLQSWKRRMNCTAESCAKCSDSDSVDRHPFGVQIRKTEIRYPPNTPDLLRQLIRLGVFRTRSPQYEEFYVVV